MFTNVKSGEEEEGVQRETKKFRSIRSFYPEGVESNTFIIDAMKTGNVGEFLVFSFRREDGYTNQIMRDFVS